MKLPKLFDRDKDLKVVEKRKFWFIAPAVIVFIAIIMGIVWNFVPGRSAVNIAIDFTGGYAFTVRLGTRLTNDNWNDYAEDIRVIARDLAPEATAEQPSPSPFGLNIHRREMFLQGSGENASIYFRFRGLRSPDERTADEFMNDVTERLVEELMVLFAFVPQIVTTPGTVPTTAASCNATSAAMQTTSGNVIPETRTVHLRYTQPLRHVVEHNPDNEGLEIFSAPIQRYLREEITTFASRFDIEITDIQPLILDTTTNVSYLTFTANFTIVEGVTSEAVINRRIVQAFTIDDIHAGRATPSGMTSAVMGTELLMYGILALLLALTLMLIYVAFRFDLSSGAAAIIGLIHDVVIMLSLMIIFNIEIGVTFIAAVITILGYSLNNTIILFDRAREKIKPLKGKWYDAKKVANDSVRDTVFRSFMTTITGLLPMAAIALIGFFGVPTIQIFAFPIIIGLIAGTYSTLTILPSIWYSAKTRYLKKQERLGLLDMDTKPPDEVAEATVQDTAPGAEALNKEPT